MHMTTKRADGKKIVLCALGCVVRMLDSTENKSQVTNLNKICWAELLLIEIQYFKMKNEIFRASYRKLTHINKNSLKSSRQSLHTICRKIRSIPQREDFPMQPKRTRTSSK